MGTSVSPYEQGGLATLMGAHPRPVPNKNDGRGLHSSTFQLNVSTLCGIRWARDFPPVY
jgi:hypothetical protein